MKALRPATLGVALSLLLVGCGSNDKSPAAPPPDVDDGTVIESLTLSGTVPAAAALGGARVVVQLDDRSAETTVETDHSYTLTLNDVAADAFVTIAVRGASDRSDIALRSLVGTVAVIASAAGADAVATVDEVPALALNSLNTAATGYVLEPGGVKARGGIAQTPRTDAELAAARAAIDTTARLSLAAAIEQVMRDRIALPAGVATTAVLARSPGAREAFVDARVQSDTEALRDAAVAMADAASAGPDLILPQDFYFTDSLHYAERFTLAADGTAVVEGYASNVAGTAAHWSEQDGVLRVTLDQVNTIQRSRDVDGDGDPFNDERVSASEQVVYELRLIGDAIPHGPQSSAAAMLDRQTRRSFPGTALPDELDRRIYLGDVVFTARLPAVAPSRFAGKTLALDIPYRDGVAIGVRAGVAQFQAGGAGLLARSGGAFAWVVADNVLTLDFSDGTQATYRLIGDIDGRAERYAVSYAFPDYPFPWHATATVLAVDAEAAIGEAAGRYLSWGGTPGSYLGLISSDEVVLQADGSGELRQTSNSMIPSTGRVYFGGATQTTAAQVSWSSVSAGIRIDEGDHGCTEAPCPPHYVRDVEPLAIDAERVYVIESLYRDENLLQRFIRRYDRWPL